MSSDIHVDHPGNLDGLQSLPLHHGDWLIVVGDVADRPAGMKAAWELPCDRFEVIPPSGPGAG